jgi:hypothetical protein
MLRCAAACPMIAYPATASSTTPRTSTFLPALWPTAYARIASARPSTIHRSESRTSASAADAATSAATRGQVTRCATRIAVANTSASAANDRLSDNTERSHITMGAVEANANTTNPVSTRGHPGRANTAAVHARKHHATIAITVCMTTKLVGVPVTRQRSGATGGRTPDHNDDCW